MPKKKEKVPLVLPKYKCHKEVHALKIKSIELDEVIALRENRKTDGGALITPADKGQKPFTVTAVYLARHNPQVGGYFIVYEDGYLSYSPGEVFEDGYDLVK